jgi:aspartyl-tRNA(Asn)/glutamyl-tRNA(Gln) amidotransferase subunit A
MPNGFGEAGMPTGFLLSAPHGCDEALLSAGMGIEDLVRGG